MFHKSQEKVLTDGSSWTSGYTAINYNLIRYADVLLMAAETEVEPNNLKAARTLVNLVRARAANATYFVTGTDGKPAANYLLKQYTETWKDASTARAAVRFERKLELSGEGHRFFDLVRWGVAEQAINAYCAYEGGKLPGTFTGAKFTANKNEVMPIPQTQIDRQGSTLTQNKNYQQ